MAVPGEQTLGSLIFKRWRKIPPWTDQVLLALGNLLLFKNLTMFMFLHLRAQKWFWLNPLCSLSAEDIADRICRSCLSVFMDPSVPVPLTFCFFPVMKNGLYCKAICEFNQILYVEYSGVPVTVIVIVVILLLPPLLICTGEMWWRYLSLCFSLVSSTHP